MSFWTTASLKQPSRLSATNDDVIATYLCNLQLDFALCYKLQDLLQLFAIWFNKSQCHRRPLPLGMNLL